MPFRKRSIAREMGAAFAVVAIYVLTLLVPLHQAAGLQRDLASIGFEAVPGWSICSSLAENKDGNTSPVPFKCAASGIAKNDLAAAEPAVVHVGAVRLGETIAYVPLRAGTSLSLAPHAAQARAPPALA